MQNDSTATNVDIMFGVSRMRDHLHRELGKVFRKFGLTSMQFAVLEILRRQGDLSVGEIRTGILSTQGNLPVVIGNLQKQRRVERTPSNNDRRVTIVRLTQLGGETFDAVFPSYLARLGELLDGYTATEKSRLTGLLSAFAHRNTIAEPSAGDFEPVSGHW